MQKNNPLPDAALAELDRLFAERNEGDAHMFNWRQSSIICYPALRQRLTDAESRLADAEREIEFLRRAGEAEANFWVNVIRSLDKENLCDFFDGSGAEEELQRWLAARDAQQRREGAAAGIEQAREMLSMAESGEQADEMMREASRKLRAQL